MPEEVGSGRRGLKNGQRPATGPRKERARDLRGTMSVSEKALWMWLRKERTGFRFRRQHAVDLFTLDYFCPEAMLNIEVDGEQHEATRDSDRERDARLRAIGIEVIRIPSLDLFERNSSLNKWIERIVEACEERTGRKGKVPEF